MLFALFYVNGFLNLLPEAYGLAKGVGAEEGAVGVDGGAVEYGVGYMPAELLALEGAPVAEALYGVGGDGPWLALANDGDVGFVAWAQEAALGDGEEACGVVCHELYEALEGKDFLIDEAEHGDE